MAKKAERKKGTTSWVKRSIYIVMALSVGAYMVYMIVASATKNIETDYAIAYTCSETVSADAFIIRDEHIVYQETSGILAYNAENGSKVSSGSIVAEVYDTEEGAKTRSRIDQIDNTLESLGGFESSENIAANAQTIDGKIDQAMVQYIEAAEEGDAQGFSKAKTNLLENLNKKQIATGQSAGISNYISQLTAEKESLAGSLNPKAEIRTENAGFFIKSSDGYEDVLRAENIDEITSADIKSALESKPKAIADNAVGRVCSSDEWYIATIIEDNSLDLREGNNVIVTIPMLSSKELKCEVHRVNKDAAQKQLMLILSCSDMDEGLALGRKEKIEICLSTYTGLRVNSSALRKVDNSVTGVYVLSGVTAKFVPVNVLYSDTGFAICEYDPKTSGTLRVYDEVITKGVNLTDGKVVR